MIIHTHSIQLEFFFSLPIQMQEKPANFFRNNREKPNCGRLMQKRELKTEIMLPNEKEEEEFLSKKKEDQLDIFIYKNNELI